MKRVTGYGLRVTGYGFSRPEGTFHLSPPIYRWDDESLYMKRVTGCGLRVTGCGFSRPEGTFHLSPPIYRWDDESLHRPKPWKGDTSWLFMVCIMKHGNEVDSTSL